MVIGTALLDVERAREAVNQVVDPEIPVLTIAELGILRDIIVESGKVTVTITPTYSGCPALHQIEDDIRSGLLEAGFDQIVIMTTHHPAWTTDWMGPEARDKLIAFGIAPPSSSDAVLCPRCDASGPRVVSRFGSTACKALMVCGGCGEPFDWFKEF
ncbi:MAG TPA: 1,2-phenylacetyl-CoA epoxidase subunit PaaD [Acidimicrobiia bacterium]|nr:1,2-phenylacetyl-CoA epoxidase subunit PaaD [Acidimicrobiia bacterium]